MAKLNFLLFVSLFYFTFVNGSFDPKNSVIIHGYRFAVLDDTEPTLTTLGCQPNAIGIPEPSSGWKIASADNIIHRMAVASYPWGTSCLVMENGISLVTQTLNSCGDQNLLTNNGKYSVRICDQKILVYQTEPVDLAAEFIECSSFEQTEGNCDSWVTESSEVEIAGSLHAHWTEGDPILISQSSDVSDSISASLATGFQISISSYCLNDNDSDDSKHPSDYHVQFSAIRKIPFEGTACDGTWTTKSINIMPEKQIKTFELSFSFGPSAPANVEWKDLKITSIDNLLENPSFHGSGLGPLKSWGKAGLGYMPDLPRVDDEDKSFASSIFLVSSRVDEHSNVLQGIYQTVNGTWPENNGSIQGLYIGAYSKTYELTGTMDDNFGVVLDIEYADGSFCFGQTLQLPTGTSSHWIYSDHVFQLTKPISRVNVTIILREHTGAAWVDNVYLSVVRARKEILSCNMGIFGDPRIKTMFNEIYDFQTPGEYSLFTTEGLHIQSRHTAFREANAGSLLSAIAIELGSLQVSIQFDEAGANGWDSEENFVLSSRFPSIYVNGELNEDGSTILVPGLASLTRTDYVTKIPTVEGNLPTNSTNSTNSAISSSSDSSKTSDTSAISSNPSDSSEDSIGILEKIVTKVEHIQERSETAEYGFTESVQGSKYSFLFPSGEIEVHARYILDDDYDTTGEPPNKIAGYLQAIVSVKSSLCASADGLFGNGAKQSLNSNTGDSIDITTASSSEIQETAVTWQVAEANSLFSYKNGFSALDYAASVNNTVAEVEYDDTCIYWAVVNCDRQVLTTLNESCVDDVLLMQNNPFIIQNYHTIEAQLMLVTSPIQERTAPDSLIYHPQEEKIDSGDGFRLTLIISISVFVIIVALVIISRRRKRRKQTAAGANDQNSEIELEEMLTENERVEMFE